MSPHDEIHEIMQKGDQVINEYPNLGNLFSFSFLHKNIKVLISVTLILMSEKYYM
jgi:hypothetical protein